MKHAKLINFIFERQNFQRVIQHLPRHLEISCSFGEMQDRLIQDKIVLGVKDDTVREKCVKYKRLVLDKYIDIGRAYENFQATNLNYFRHKCNRSKH